MRGHASILTCTRTLTGTLLAPCTPLLAFSSCSEPRPRMCHAYQAAMQPDQPSRAVRWRLIFSRQADDDNTERSVPRSATPHRRPSSSKSRTTCGLTRPLLKALLRDNMLGLWLQLDERWSLLITSPRLFSRDPDLRLGQSGLPRPLAGTTVCPRRKQMPRGQPSVDKLQSRFAYASWCGHSRPVF